MPARDSVSASATKKDRDAARDLLVDFACACDQPGIGLAITSALATARAEGAAAERERICAALYRQVASLQGVVTGRPDDLVRDVLIEVIASQVRVIATIREGTR